MNTPNHRIRRIRILITVVIIGLALSGLTAFCLESEMKFAINVLGFGAHAEPGSFAGWIVQIHNGLSETNTKYPFIAYGTDWLGFSHLVLAVLFTGILQDPVRNKWVINFGLIACVAILPTAFVFGQVRGIPIYWRLIDSLFGILCFIPLWLARNDCTELENATQAASLQS